ncbi:Kelch repeat-containing protein [Oceanobacillus damuensis]|uniref:hypothetical protein n=1 Tax=Oceanobacillus damuensis TaxID=937928 RepID=UPI00082BD506|nr:hypothetical protein [Oceanobacillus damuensis]
MKRYWKLISIVLIIVLVIGTFYIQSSMAASNYPEFVIETVSGNQEEVEQLSLLANYRNGMIYDNVTITENGAEYVSEGSFLEQLEGSYANAEIKRLQEDYRHFMRGKTGSPRLFFEDQSKVAYADLSMETLNNRYKPSDFSFDISVLDKDSDKNTSFELPLPERESYNFVSMEGVYIVGGEMKLITHNSKGRAGSVEIHVYSINIDTEEIVGDEVILKSEEINDNSFLEIRKENANGNLDSNRNVLFEYETFEEVKINEWESYLEPTEKDFIVYNLETNEREVLNLPEEIRDSANAVFVSDEKIYFAQEADGKPEILIYDFDTERIEAKQSFSIQSPVSELVFNIKNDKLYITSSYMNMRTKATILILDLKTGETLYEGFIKMENPRTEQMDYELYIRGTEIE